MAPITPSHESPMAEAQQNWQRSWPPYPQHGSSIFLFLCANFVRKQNKRALSTRSIAPCKTGRTSDDHSQRQHCPHNSEMGESMLDCTQEATFPTTQRTRWRSFSGRGNRRIPMGRKWLLACNSGNQRKRPENAKARQQTLRLKEVARS